MNLPFYAYIWRTSHWWFFLTYKPYFDRTGIVDTGGSNAMFPAIRPYDKACDAEDGIDEPLDEYFRNSFSKRTVPEIQAFLKDHFANKGIDLIFGNERYENAVKPHIKP